MERLKFFAQQYFDNGGGVSSLEAYLPEDMTEKQIKVYVAMAIYIDKVAFPIYSGLIDNISIDDDEISTEDHELCKLAAAAKLTLAGVEFGVSQLVDIMTDGAGFTIEGLEDALLAAAVTQIWIEYEHCNGRWH
ncbi:MAG: hypothetical protein K2H61_03260 [Muribaculaceae bacterium]|nr:hypothetical protein [Muribaculaceae bacterium]